MSKGPRDRRAASSETATGVPMTSIAWNAPVSDAEARVNVLEPEAAKRAGFAYQGMGRR